MDCIDLAQDREQWRALVNTVMNLWVPWNVGKFLSSCTIGGFSRKAQLHEWVSEVVFNGHSAFRFYFSVPFSRYKETDARLEWSSDASICCGLGMFYLQFTGPRACRFRVILRLYDCKFKFKFQIGPTIFIFPNSKQNPGPQEYENRRTEISSVTYLTRNWKFNEVNFRCVQIIFHMIHVHSDIMQRAPCSVISTHYYRNWNSLL
jgi:hypothetical protein